GSNNKEVGLKKLLLKRDRFGRIHQGRMPNATQRPHDDTIEHLSGYATSQQVRKPMHAEQYPRSSGPSDSLCKILPEMALSGGTSLAKPIGELNVPCGFGISFNAHKKNSVRFSQALNP